MSTRPSVYFGYVAYVFMAREHDDAVGHVVRHRYVLFAVLATVTVPAVLATPEDFAAGLISDYAHGHSARATWLGSPATSP